MNDATAALRRLCHAAATLSLVMACSLPATAAAPNSNPQPQSTKPPYQRPAQRHKWPSPQAVSSAEPPAHKTNPGLLGAALKSGPVLTLVLEGGTSRLAPHTVQRRRFEARWAGLGGGTIGLRLTDVIGLQLQAGHHRFTASAGVQSATTYSAGAVWSLDTTKVVPFGSISLGYSQLRGTDGRNLERRFLPIVGIGFDMPFEHWLVGAVARYHPLLGSSLRTNPAYVTIHLRLGLRLQLGALI